MLVPDLDIGRRFVMEHKPPGTMLLCSVTGAHHYGFPSKDSDIDLKGIHLAPTDSLLGLNSPVETKNRLEIFEEVECDFTSHEARKAFKLLISGNGNILERICSPYQLFDTPFVEDIRALALGSVSKRYSGHYLGYFHGMCKEHERNVKPRAKSLLYTYRVALTGVHLMRTGRIEADLNINAPVYGFTEILELIQFKRERGEKSALPTPLDQTLRSRWGELEKLLQDSVEKSGLPDEAANGDDWEAWLKNKRMSVGLK